ncbi:Scr1 family TA system antitoxin-like transcriptional regulator [Actinomadura sp. NPDC000600]|uniref:helix-turn-helix domain-containing protein n=1 Tax=Actinomadura sp. NPDC000600 TaxID=3154262 RepID=UPI0033982D9B
MPQPPKRLTPSNSPLDLFGSEVRRYRVLADHSIKQLADKIPYSASFIGAVERAECHCERNFAEHCDAVLDTKQALSHLHDGLFGDKKDGFPEWFRKWPEVEEDAGALKVYEPIVIYGLLQREDYASTLLFGDREAVDARLARQSILTRTSPLPPRLIYILPETVLWNDVGGPAVMRPQLERLVEAVGPRLSIQVVPNGARHPGNEGTFTVATRPGGEEIAFAETALRGIMIEERKDISRLKDRFDAISTQALPVGMSVDLIRRTLDEKWRS